MFVGFLKEALILFAFVTLHELCHVISANIFKMETRNIELYPFGGVARIDNMDSAGLRTEIVISAAGPLFNICAASLIFFLREYGMNIPYYKLIMEININLALFNLLPGLPLDGGRIIRAAMSYYVGFKKATRTAVMMGKIVAIALLAYGAISALRGTVNLSFIVMPFFIYISANKEEDMLMYTVIKDVINKKRYMKDKKVMDAVEICVYESTAVREVLKYFDKSKFHIIIVINDDMDIQAVFTEAQILNSLAEHGTNTTLGQLCRKIKR